MLFSYFLGEPAEPRGDRHAAGTWPVTLADIKGSSKREMISSLAFMCGNTGDFQPAEPPPQTLPKNKAQPPGKIHRRLIASVVVKIFTESSSKSALLAVAPGGRTRLGTRSRNEGEGDDCWMCDGRVTSFP